MRVDPVGSMNHLLRSEKETQRRQPQMFLLSNAVFQKICEVTYQLLSLVAQVLYHRNTGDAMEKHLFICHKKRPSRHVTGREKHSLLAAKSDHFDVLQTWEDTCFCWQRMLKRSLLSSAGVNRTWNGFELTLFRPVFPLRIFWWNSQF